MKALSFRGFLAAALVVAAQAAQAQDPGFMLEFAPCSQMVEGNPGGAYTAEVDCTLTTANNPTVGTADEAGAQGWSISVSSDGLTIDAITTDGTAGGPESDGPPGLRKASSFEQTQLTTQGIDNCMRRNGAVSAVVLALTENVTLPAEGTQPIAKLMVSGTFPAAGENTPVQLLYADSCQGSGQPVPNNVTFRGR